ncbi:hypothetical protein PR048_022170 [Dryococelus australis]|uniref:Uncharacterized protein n=1 Tax=Dryococelus australis TaxID=614101 RepID=A0ABQ9H0C3_9NEOP|nr:hypothetical protein PR048_022170 [Dryococelus australis]
MTSLYALNSKILMKFKLKNRIDFLLRGLDSEHAAKQDNLHPHSTDYFTILYSTTFASPASEPTTEDVKNSQAAVAIVQEPANEEANTLKYVASKLCTVVRESVAAANATQQLTQEPLTDEMKHALQMLRTSLIVQSGSKVTCPRSGFSTPYETSNHQNIRLDSSSFLDEHYIHTRNTYVIDLARAYYVRIVSLSPHSNHRLQPLDETIIGTFETYYNEEVWTYTKSTGKRGLPPRRTGFNSWPVHFGFLQVGIVPDDATSRKVFARISRFSHPFILALLHTHLTSPSSALKTSLL